MFQAKKDPGLIEWSIKEWFIIISHQQEGPYSLLDLKRDPRFTPDTLVWRKGFKEWMSARFVPEMQEIFKDETEINPYPDPETQRTLDSLGQPDQVTLAILQDPHQFYLWILIIFLTLLYTFYQIYYK